MGSELSLPELIAMAIDIAIPHGGLRMEEQPFLVGQWEEIRSPSHTVGLELPRLIKALDPVAIVAIPHGGLRTLFLSPNELPPRTSPSHTVGSEQAS